MAIRELPARPNLEHLNNQARTLLRQTLASDTSSNARFAAFGIITTTPKLADALHIIAREYGFDTWPALKLHIDVASEDPAEALTAAIKANNPSLVRDVLVRHPSLKSRINEPLIASLVEVPTVACKTGTNGSLRINGPILRPLPGALSARVFPEDCRADWSAWR